MRITIEHVRDAFADAQIDNLYIGDIPQKILNNALNGLRMAIPRSQVLAVYDSCIFFNHGDQGFAITPTGIFFRDSGEKSIYKGWGEIQSVESGGPRIRIGEDYCFAFSSDVNCLVKGLSKLIEVANGEGTKGTDMSNDGNAAEEKVVDEHAELKFFFASTNDKAGVESQRSKIVRGPDGTELIEFSMVCGEDAGDNNRVTFYWNGANECYCFIGNQDYGKFVTALDEGKIKGLDKDVENAWPKFYDAWRAAKVFAGLKEIPEAAEKMNEVTEQLLSAGEVLPRLIVFPDFPCKKDLSWFTGFTTKNDIQPAQLWKIVMPLFEYSAQMMKEIRDNELGNKFRMLGYTKAVLKGVFKVWRMGAF